MKNKEAQFWDTFAVKYDSFMAKRASKAYREVFGQLRFDTKNTVNLLEIATGTGIISFELCKQVSQIVATDLSPEMIKTAKEKAAKQSVTNIDFRIEDACHLSFSDNSFDTVIASNVLHLLVHPDKALKEMKRVLKKDGQVILPTYCHGNSLKSRMISNLMSLATRKGFKANSRWSVKSFTNFVLQNGFRIIRENTIKGSIPLVYLTGLKK